MQLLLLQMSLLYLLPLYKRASMPCALLLIYVYLRSVRRVVQDLPLDSSTAATGSRRECTPWLWSLPCPQKECSSYLHRYCKQRTQESSPNRKNTKNTLSSLPQTLSNFTTTKPCFTSINNLQAATVTATLSLCQNTHLFRSWHCCNAPCSLRYVH